MLTEQEIIDEIKLDEAGRIFVRKTSVIMRNGVEVSRAHHRWTLEPDAEPDASFPTDIVDERLGKAKSFIASKRPQPPKPIGAPNA